MPNAIVLLAIFNQFSFGEFIDLKISFAKKAVKLPVTNDQKYF